MTAFVEETDGECLEEEFRLGLEEEQSKDGRKAEIHADAAACQLTGNHGVSTARRAAMQGSVGAWMRVR